MINPPTSTPNLFPSSGIEKHLATQGKSQLNNTQQTWENILKQTRTQTGIQGHSPLFRFGHSTAQPSASASTTPTAELNAKKQQLFNAAQSFEALLVYQMFKAMEQTLGGDKLLGENQASKIFKDFLTSERSALAVKSGSTNMGLAKIIYERNSQYIF